MRGSRSQWQTGCSIANLFTPQSDPWMHTVDQRGTVAKRITVLWLWQSMVSAKAFGRRYEKRLRLTLLADPLALV
jgi:hypothetical protein